MADEQAPPPQPAAAPASKLPTELQTAGASSDDRSMAMIAHILCLASFLGPLILYLMKKDGASKFLKFHMLQALWFQVAVCILFVVMIMLTIVATIVTAGIASCVCFPFISLIGLGNLVYFIIGAITVNGGKDFEYMVVGPWVRKSL
jgi:hypothetical protein